MITGTSNVSNMTILEPSNKGRKKVLGASSRSSGLYRGRNADISRKKSSRAIFRTTITKVEKRGSRNDENHIYTISFIYQRQ